MSWRLLNIQGIAGLISSLAMLGLFVAQKLETRHWRKQSSQFERLYRDEKSAAASTVANYRAAAEAARSADRAAAARVAAEQRAISERSTHEYEARLAAARAAAERLRVQAAAGAADPRTGRAAPVPAARSAAGAADGAAAQDGFSVADRLIATEQAIQLDALIKWVRAQSNVDPNAAPR